MNIWLAEIWRAWRASLRKPGFLLLATGVLALGIGSTVAVFTLIDQVLLEPLPLPDASRVAVVGTVQDGQRLVSPLQYQHLKSIHGIESTGLTLFTRPNVNLTGGVRPQVVSAAYIDRGMLPTLGLHPLLGRNFTAREDAPHGPHVVMLGYAFWRSHFAGDPNVLGRTLDVKGIACMIVGVLPKSFDSLAFSGDIALPLALSPHSTDDGLNDIAVVRLPRGASVQSAGAAINERLHAMYAAMGSRYVENWKDARFGARPITVWQRAAAHSTLMLFLACAMLVLLAALVNLINLMLLRALGRTHEIAVRGALGASRLRLALPALAEGLLVGMIGALLGTGLAWIGMRLVQGSVSADWLPGGAIHMRPWIAGLALVVALAVAGLAAAIGVWRAQVASGGDALREGGRSGLARHGSRVGRVLVVAQVLLAAVLLCGSGLLLHGLYEVAHTPLGFDGGHALTFALAPVQAEYPDARSVNALSQRLVERLERIPGVTMAAATTSLPAGSLHTFNTNVHSPGGQPIDMDYVAISPDYFRLFGVPVLRGRAFAREDVRGGEPVAVVNRALARRMYAGHALGQRIEEGSGAGAWSARIVGVVGNTRQFGPLQAAPPIVYVPLAQVPDDNLQFIRYFMPLRFVLRGHGDPARWRVAVRAAVGAIAPNQPISHLRTMGAIVRTTMAPARRTLWLVGVFATLALLLAMAGIYAVMAVSVAAREREFGVRQAMGARPARLVRLVLLGGLVQIVAGLVIGLAVVLAASGLLQRLLVELVARPGTFDPVALASTCVVLCLAGLLACLLPALRAGRVQPMSALRGE